MKIIGFTQLRNELSRGNLQNWFRCMEVCDHIYIYDQASDDGSQDYYKKFPNVTVIQSETNDFKKEILCKAKMLERIRKEHTDSHWIYWLDGDLIMDGRMLENKGQKIREMIDIVDKKGHDCILLGHYNLWRSDVWYRVDEGYHNHHGRWFTFWKDMPYMWYPLREGLHHGQAPDGIRNPVQVDTSVIHRGFSSDENIIKKYLAYRDMGQTGWDLDRLIDEKTLNVQKIPEKIIPSWYSTKDNQDPRTKNKLIDIYKKELCT